MECRLSKVFKHLTSTDFNSVPKQKSQRSTAWLIEIFRPSSNQKAQLQVKKGEKQLI